MSTDTVDRLLEPGRLLGGALARDMLRCRLDVLELRPGEMLGAFRVLRELGRGGTGIVYLAERADGAYQQQVAIKWLPVGKSREEQAERFRRERQIHARLRHPHIARLLDGGVSESGHLWFALEHVEGLPIDRHVVQAGMGWQARLRLLLPVLDAVQSAHGQLLLHRDITPANVLVDCDGRPKLIDFGIAALHDDARPPHAATPGFASPEQLAGAPAALTSDIWQLGRLVQHVLAARVVGQAPPRLSGDLAAVLTKACHRQPARRYSSVAALRDELQRVLDYRPVIARPPRPLRRLRLLACAHPLGAACSALALLAFAAMVTGFMLKLARERDTARHAQIVAEAVNDFLDRDFLPGADPLQGGSSDESVAGLSERALARVEPRLHDLPAVAGRVELSLGRTLANLGRFKPARRALSHAIWHLARAYGASDERVLAARLMLAQIAIDPASLQQAQTRLQALRREVLASLGAHAPLLRDVDAQLARSAFLRDDFALCQQRYQALLPRLADAGPVEQAGVYMGLGLCQSRLGQWTQALAHARQARALDEAALGKNHPLTLETHIAVAAAQIGLGQYAQAATLLDDLTRRLRKRYGPLHPTTLTVTHDLGLALACAGQPDAGARALQLAAAGRAATLGIHHPWYAMTESVLGMALLRGHHVAAAATALQRARAALGARVATAPYVQVTLLQNEGDLALARHRLRDAVEHYNAATALARRTYPAGTRRLAMLQLGLGLALTDENRPGPGPTLLRRALQKLGTRPDCRDGLIALARQRVTH